VGYPAQCTSRLFESNWTE